jgi:hypothetical protein
MDSLRAQIEQIILAEKVGTIVYQWVVDFAKGSL